MVHHCKFCGDKLDAEEVEQSEEIGFYACHDCLNHGITLLQRVLGKADRDG